MFFAVLRSCQLTRIALLSLLAAMPLPALWAQTAPSSIPKVPSATRQQEAAETKRAPVLSAEDELDKARNLFAYGDYRAASEVLSELTLPGRLAKKRDLVETHRMLAIAFFQLGNRAEARREFMALMYLAPDTKLDPFLTPPNVVEFYNGIREEIADKLEVVRQKRDREQKESQPVPTVTLVERTKRSRSWLANFVPLGYPQFERGDWGWGLVFVSAQVLSVATVAGTYVATQFVKGQDGRIAPDDEALYQGVKLANWTSGGIALIVYAGGVLEAFVSYQPETLEAEVIKQVPRDNIEGLAKTK